MCLLFWHHWRHGLIAVLDTFSYMIINRPKIANYWELCIIIIVIQEFSIVRFRPSPIRIIIGFPRPNEYAAVAGFSTNTSLSTFLPGSGTNEVLNLTRTSNVNIPGIWMFQVDGIIIIYNNKWWLWVWEENRKWSIQLDLSFEMAALVYIP